jgi:hypothetical protein
VPFHCNAESDDEYDEWSAEKRWWCCREEQLGCVKVASANAAKTTSTPIDCFTDRTLYNEWPRWKQDYCCNNHGLCGKDESSPHSSVLQIHGAFSEPFDCLKGQQDWELHWTPEQSDYCCEHHNVGCAIPAAHGFDCQESLRHWEVGWSEEKKSWCCYHQQIGCQSDMLKRFERPPSHRTELVTGPSLKVLRAAERILGPSSLGFLAGLSLLVLLNGICRAATWGHAARGLRPGAGREGYLPVASEGAEETP